MSFTKEFLQTNFGSNSGLISERAKTLAIQVRYNSFYFEIINFILTNG